MKVFTLNEANALLALVEPMLRRIREHYSTVSFFRESSNAAAISAELGGGGMEGGTSYVHVLYELGKLTTQLDQMGVQLKDYSRGLVDFPSMREGRVVLLCWQLEDGGEIEWWHEIDDGFVGRKRL